MSTVVQAERLGAFGDRFKKFLIDHPNLVPALLAILKMFGLVLMDDGTVKAVPSADKPSDIDILATAKAAVASESEKVAGTFLDIVKFLLANKELVAQIVAFIKAMIDAFTVPTPAPTPLPTPNV